MTQAASPPRSPKHTPFHTIVGGGVSAPTRRSRLHRTARRAAVASALVLSLVAALVLGTSTYVERSARPHVVSVAEAPSRAAVLVLGAGLFDGMPSPILTDRLETARELYARGIVSKILVSGDNSRPDYDEPSAMRRWLVARGVLEADVVRDFAGFRTLDSLYRAHHVFGLDRLLVVTNAFHAPRAVYIGRALGLDVVGVVAPERYDYSGATKTHNALREHFARAAAFVDVRVLGTGPRFDGPKAPIVSR